MLHKLISIFLIFLIFTSTNIKEAKAEFPRNLPSNPYKTQIEELFSQHFLTSSRFPTLQTKKTTDTELLTANAEGVTFSVTVPWQLLKVEEITIDEKLYTRVSLPDWSLTSQTGSPELPFLAETIGIPFGVNLSVQVVTGPIHKIALSAPPLPAAGLKAEIPLPGVKDLPTKSEPTFVIDENPEIYSSLSKYPGSTAEVASDGVLRQQRIAAIAIYPIQYLTTSKELIVYESLQVEVKFAGSPSKVTATQTEKFDSPIYENLFRQNLLNYETARRWRQPGVMNSSHIDPGLDEVSIPWTPPDPGWRIKIREEGFYKITYQELLDAELQVENLVPSTFQLYNQGSEVAIYVEGEEDGSFDDTDYLLFYGQRVESKYTSDNVYWLTYGQSPGLRMFSRDGTPGEAEIPDTFTAQEHLEENAYYLSLTPGHEDLERWMWDYVYRPVKPSSTHTFSLYSAVVDQPGSLSLALLGYMQNAVNPDHHAKISLNGSELYNVTWDDVTWKISEIPIPPDTLLVGDNTLTIESIADTGISNDVFYIDRADLYFSSRFLAENDQLAFTYSTTGSWKFRVDGLSTDQVSVYDISDPTSVIKLDNILVVQADSTYYILFQDTLDTRTKYWVMADTAYRSIQSIELDTASNLWSSLNGADEIIIYHHNFQNQAEQLSSFRNLAPEMRAVAVDSQDIYDEFGYGIVGADAIHEFLVYTYNSWQAPAPSYVLLIGDGNYDPKNHVYTRESFIPPYLAPVDPWIGETAADNRYVTLDFEDTFPDMMLGRLAVNSTDEASAFVDKIINYEQNTEQSDWKQRVLFIADNADSDGNFPQSSDDLLECCLPAPYQSEKIYLGVTHPTSDQARSAIQNGINSGNFIVNYIGHASATQWASEGLFKSEDVAGLANDGMLPVMLTMTCYDGYYIYPHQSADGYDSTAEVITRANGKGAIASWSPTGLGVSSGHEHLNQGFFEALFYSGASTLGETTYAGKFNLWSTGNNLDLLDTYLLFGDPAMSMPVIPTTITANDDEYQTDQDSLLTVSTADGVLKNDLGYDGFSLTTVIDLDANHGALSLGGDGSFTYMPEQNWNGTDIYTYRAFDGYKYSNVATVTITVNPLQEKFFIFLPLLFNNTESDITR